MSWKGDYIGNGFPGCGSSAWIGCGGGWGPSETLYSFGNLNLLGSKDFNTEVVLQVKEMKATR